MTKLVALTGNIGSGKSYVSSLFAEVGIPIFYSDTEAKKLYYEGDIKQALTARFGDTVYLDDGSLNKPYMASLIFGDKEAAQFIEGLLYPALNKNFIKWVENQDSRYIIYESAIIFEKHFETQFDYVIMVSADENTRLRRVMLRDSCDETSVRNRMKAQWSDECKAFLADFVIRHDFDDEDDYLRQRVAEINKEIIKLTTNGHQERIQERI